MKDKRKIVDIVFFLLIGIGILFIHIYKLDSIPYGINVDEMGMGYDAYCLANYGVDRYLNPFPLYFINFCAGQSVLYGYICAIFVKMFGLSIWTMRLPAVVFALLTVYFGVKLVRLRYGDSKFHIYGFMLLYMVCPVFMFLFRIGLDCNLMLGMITIFLYFLCKAVDTQKDGDFLLSGIIGGLTLYSYILSYIMLPVFLLLLLAYVIYLKKINWKQFMLCLFPLGILAFPLLLIQMIQILDLNTIHLGMFTLPKLYQYRANEITLSAYWDNFKNIWKVIFMYDPVRFDSTPKFGNMYYISIPFLIIGILHNAYKCIKSIKGKEWDISVPLLLWFLVEIFIGCIFKELEQCLYRFNAIYIVMLFFLLDGLYLLVETVIYRLKKYGYILCGALITAYVVLFTSFIKYYFVEYPNESKMQLFNHTFEDALTYLEEKGLSENKTYVGAIDQAYIYYLGSTLMSPYDFYRGEIANSQELWEWANYYNNYDFNLPKDPVMKANYVVDVQDIE